MPASVNKIKNKKRRKPTAQTQLGLDLGLASPPLHAAATAGGAPPPHETTGSRLLLVGSGGGRSPHRSSSSSRRWIWRRARPPPEHHRSGGGGRRIHPPCQPSDRGTRSPERKGEDGSASPAAGSASLRRRFKRVGPHAPPPPNEGAVLPCLALTAAHAPAPSCLTLTRPT
jgi:hypothetical protein